MKEYKGYIVTETGEVFNKFGRKMSTYVSHCGYVGTVISGRKHISIHRVVAELYLPNPEDKKTVNHKNGIKTDNRVENLEWMTHRENKKHSHDVLKVKTCKGVKKNWKNGNPNAKLTDEIVSEIKLALKNGEYGIDLAWKYGLCTMTISRINTNKIFKHIL